MLKHRRVLIQTSPFLQVSQFLKKVLNLPSSAAEKISQQNRKPFFITLASLASASFFMISCTPSESQRLPASLQIQEGSSILGGSEVANATPVASHTVGIVDTLTGGVCTGSLLDNNFVLTAAHCLNQNPKKMVLVFNNVIKRSVRDQLRWVSSAAVSEQWKEIEATEKNQGDIALIHFKGTIPRGYTGMKLLDDPRRLRRGMTVSIAGYGDSSALARSGTGVLRQTQVTLANEAFSETEMLLDQSHGRGACYGDSGGPAWIRVGGIDYLWGVARGGYDDDNEQCDNFSVYTNALIFKTWIQKAAQILYNLRPEQGTSIRLIH